MTKKEINKELQEGIYKSLEFKYFIASKNDENFIPDRVAFGMAEMTKVAKYFKRSLITKEEYRNQQIAIDRFMF